MLIVADRLKITLKQVSEMSEEEYNTCLVLSRAKILSTRF